MKIDGTMVNDVINNSTVVRHTDILENRNFPLPIDYQTVCHSKSNAQHHFNILTKTVDAISIELYYEQRMLFHDIFIRFGNSENLIEKRETTQHCGHCIRRLYGRSLCLYSRLFCLLSSR